MARARLKRVCRVRLRPRWCRRRRIRRRGFSAPADFRAASGSRASAGARRRPDRNRRSLWRAVLCGIRRETARAVIMRRSLGGIAMKKILGSALLAIAFLAGPVQAASHDADAGIVAFNHALAAATRAMDNDAILALWEDGGTSLLPDTPPIKGKPAMRSFLADLGRQLRGARMRKFELACHAIQINGGWASEWCEEHQMIAFANGRPPFNGTGRMLLVLHRGPNQAWRLSREMWQPALR